MDIHRSTLILIGQVRIRIGIAEYGSRWANMTHKKRKIVKKTIVLSSVADPNPDPDPRVLGLPDPDPDPLVRVMDPDPA